MSGSRSLGSRAQAHSVQLVERLAQLRRQPSVWIGFQFLGGWCRLSMTKSASSSKTPGDPSGIHAGLRQDKHVAAAGCGPSPREQLGGRYISL